MLGLQHLPAFKYLKEINWAHTGWAAPPIPCGFEQTWCSRATRDTLNKVNGTVMPDAVTMGAALAIGVCFSSMPTQAVAQQELIAERPPMPEPIFTETVTDLDGSEPGEYEIELNGSELRARRGGSYELTSTVELEMLATRRLGLRLEPQITRAGDATGVDTRYGMNFAASWKLHQDFIHDFHTQLEAGGRIPWGSVPVLSPGDPGLPYFFDIRSGIRMGRITIRGGVGVDPIGQPAHVPLRTSLALMTGVIDGSSLFGFVGIEADADGARENPIVLALNAVADCTPVGLPFRIGIALPWAIGVPQAQPALGLYIRVFFVTSREVEYGRTGGSRVR